MGKRGGRDGAEVKAATDRGRQARLPAGCTADNATSSSSCVRQSSASASAATAAAAAPCIRPHRPTASRY